ncbi:MAG: hypothetical protein ACOVMP_02525 [Chthoniobacterales bacterium]
MFGADWNPVVHAEIRKMPHGGGYAVTSEASRRFREAVSTKGSRLVVDAKSAMPSYCSSATYLLLLEVLSEAVRTGALKLDASSTAALMPGPLADGHGVWGRWNANGPGAAMLFDELRAGENFTSLAAAKPGDFLKIFWNDAVGKLERGHLVVYLGVENREDGQWIRFWSSNKPDGYGEKAVHSSKIAHMIFSRLTNPAAFSKVAQLPEIEPYLSRLLQVESSFREACAKVNASELPN